MRVTISADSMSTKQLRDLCAACAVVGIDRPTVGLNGPECWTAETAPMSPNQWAQVAGRLITLDGTPLIGSSSAVLGLGHEGRLGV